MLLVRADTVTQPLAIAPAIVLMSRTIPLEPIVALLHTPALLIVRDSEPSRTWALTVAPMSAWVGAKSALDTMPTKKAKVETVRTAAARILVCFSLSCIIIISFLCP